MERRLRPRPDIINAGVRWEAQQVRDINGDTAIALWDNLAPRVGLVYDFTGKGKSKISFNYGWYFQAIPLDINDRQFSKEGLVIQNTEACEEIGPRRDHLPRGRRQGGERRARSSSATSTSPPSSTSTAASSARSPPTSGHVQRGDHRRHRVRRRGGHRRRRQLRAPHPRPHRRGRLARRRALLHHRQPRRGHQRGRHQGPAEPDRRQERADRRRHRATRDALRQGSRRPLHHAGPHQSAQSSRSPSATTTPLQLTVASASPTTSLVQASYTYSRTIGNYPAPTRRTNGQLDPNISSQYDLTELLINRNGPLPNDRPHNFKILGAYQCPWAPPAASTSASTSAPFRRPHRGARRPPLLRPQRDLHPAARLGRAYPHAHFARPRALAWARSIGRQFRAEIRSTSSTSSTCGASPPSTWPTPAAACCRSANGSYKRPEEPLKTIDGSAPLLNPNYGQPVAHQQPLSLRLGARISF